MKSLILVCILIILISLFMAFGYWARAVPDPPVADERLTLSTPRREYLVGEPVILNLTFSNLSDQSMKLIEPIVRPDHYEIEVWIASNRDPFQVFTPNSADYKKARQSVSLAPGHKLQYSCRVVGAPWKQRPLAFPAAGTYRVYATYPLWVEGAQQTISIASNVVDVEVKNPAGEDSRVWEKLNAPRFVTLLQLDAFPEGLEDLPRKLGGILRDHPNSGYAPPIRHALSKIYFHHRNGLSDDHSAQLAKTLDIMPIETVIDNRLDISRKKPLEKDAPLSRMLADLSKLGVPLDATPALKEQKVNISESWATLRGSMRALSDKLEASWQKRGDGYLLVPFNAGDSPQAKGKDGG